ncbi:chloride channel protein C-like [Acropora palmata]|uniref:chloride channel protein C-like n=1 Tax=Acropora palmata TaxID=6131 RepID=UPI003D9FE5E7
MSLVRNPSKYGVSSSHADEDTLPTATQTSFFQKGREFESRYVNHHYTEEERQKLGTFESVDYLPPHSAVYKNWLKQQPSRLDWDRWVMMGMIGFTVGFIGFLMHQLIDVISEIKWDKASEFIEKRDFALAWVWVIGYSVLFVIASSVPVVYYRPSAGGSGIPELIGFLNGTVVRHIFNFQTMVVKFFSCVCAVGAGLPIGPEGPMIHLGSLVGAGLSQFRSETLKFKLPFFERFRNTEDRRNFISAGAAAGVASAFGAPVGGLLFSMEEVSSFWNMKLSWQTFFACMVSTFTTDLFNSAFEGFKYQGDFGAFKAEKNILFQISHGIGLNILAFIPTVILGIIGGLLGAVFTFINLKIARFRRSQISKINSKHWKNVAKLSEPVLIMIITGTASVFLPAGFGCTPFQCFFSSGGYSKKCLTESQHPLHTERDVRRYTCPVGVSEIINGTEFTNSSFNEVATLLFVTGEKAIHHLFSRDTPHELGYASLFTVLVVYFLLACWAAGTAISSGLVVPMLFIGGTYGRIIGRIMVDLFGVHTTGYWAWMDPGAFALIGAASFFGGVSRLTMSLTVIMMEITNDIQFLLPIMVAIMVAKWVGDFATHPLYHALLELKCIPFLDSEPVILHEGSKAINLELFKAGDAMSSPAIVVHKVESVYRLTHLLLDTPHGGYPVVIKTEIGDEVFFGLITRNDIMVLLSRDDIFCSGDNLSLQEEELDVKRIDYYQMHQGYGYLKDAERLNAQLDNYAENLHYQELFIDLSPYVNHSAPTVQQTFSLHRTYIIFRTLGLRHLTVVDERNRVKGIITRKDLMGFQMEERIHKFLHKSSQDQEMQHPGHQFNVEMSQ